MMLIERLAWREGPYPSGLERDVGLDVDITPGEQSTHLAESWPAADGERHLGHAGRFGRQRHLVAQGNELFAQGFDDHFDPADLGGEDGGVEEDFHLFSKFGYAKRLHQLSIECISCCRNAMQTVPRPACISHLLSIEDTSHKISESRKVLACLHICGFSPYR